MLLLLLSVPHATPYNASAASTVVDSETGVVSTHLFDETAQSFAEQLSISVNDYSPLWNVEILTGPVSRVICDLNRIECRSHPWRRQLVNRMKHATLLIDVHSYPAEHRRDLNCYFLVDEGFDAQHCSLLYLNQFLIERGGGRITTDVFHGVRNDIIDEAYNKLHRCAILLEINESNSRETNHRIASIIAEWIKQQYY